MKKKEIRPTYIQHPPNISESAINTRMSKENSERLFEFRAWKGFPVSGEAFTSFSPLARDMPKPRMNYYCQMMKMCLPKPKKKESEWREIVKWEWNGPPSIFVRNVWTIHRWSHAWWCRQTRKFALSIYSRLLDEMCWGSCLSLYPNPNEYQNMMSRTLCVYQTKTITTHTHTFMFLLSTRFSLLPVHQQRALLNGSRFYTLSRNIYTPRIPQRNLNFPNHQHLNRSPRLSTRRFSTTPTRQSTEKEEPVEKKGGVKLDISRENIYTLPNALTLSRILSCPLLGYSILDGNFTLATGILAYAGISDWVGSVPILLKIILRYKNTKTFPVRWIPCSEVPNAIRLRDNSRSRGWQGPNDYADGNTCFKRYDTEYVLSLIQNILTLDIYL